MRITFLLLIAAVLAGCATAPATDMTKVYDHKYNTVRSLAKQPDSEFVGTNASERAKSTPGWYRFGHP